MMFIDMGAKARLDSLCESTAIVYEVSNRICVTCPSPKLHPACIFNHFLMPPAARSDDATLRLRRSQSPVRAPAAASLSAPAHPCTKINVFWNGSSKRGNSSKFGVDGLRRERLHGRDTRGGWNRSVSRGM